MMSLQAGILRSRRVAEARPSAPSGFPTDAFTVRHRRSRSAMTPGGALTRQWRLRFEPRSPKFVEPMMGWAGTDDTLAQLELAFPSRRDAAMAYAQRPGPSYRVQG